MLFIRNRTASAGGSRAQKCRVLVESLESRQLLAVGTWTPLTNLAPDGIGTMMLLTNGTVMAQGPNVTNAWYALTPDASGGYVNGTWSSLASMSTDRLYFASNVLNDGLVFVQGGEYSGPNGAQNLVNTGEIYDPVANTWKTIATFPQANFGDDPSILLDNGTVLAGYVLGPQAYFYDPTADTWSSAATKLDNDASDEEGFVKLADGSILTLDVFAQGKGQRYIPSQNQWVETGPVGANLTGPLFELGPALLLPDGRAFFVGELGNTEYYTPSTNTWAAGPALPNGLGDDDAPGAVLPNGDLLLEGDAGDAYSGPTNVFEFNPTTGVYTDVTPTGLDMTGPAFVDRMLVLPTGQVLFTNSENQLAVYTPSGSASQSWKPQIESVSANADGSFTITGTQLTGMSAGAAYGDDAEMDTNYPIVELVNSNGQVFYARSYGWSSSGVQTGATAVTTNFQAPPNLPAGSYSLVVVASGIASDPFAFNTAGLTTTVVTATPAQVVYGQSVTFTADVTAVSNKFTPQGTVQFSIDGSNFGNAITLVNGLASVTDPTLAAGTHTITARFSPTDGVSSASVGTLTDGLTVSRAPLTITANDQTKNYDQAITFTGTEFTTGTLFNGDSVSSVKLTSLGAAATAKVSGSPYAIIASDAVGTGLSNYSITYVSGKLTINPLALTITAHDQSKIYGRPYTFRSSDFSTGTLYNGDTIISVSLSSPGAAANAPVSGSPYTITASAAVGAGLGNYAITYVAGEFTVNPAPLTITARNETKVYGQALPPAGNQFIAGSLFNNDAISLVTFSSPGAAASAPVSGSPYPIMPSAAIGAGLSNYTITYQLGSLQVTRAPLSITANSMTKAYGQSVAFTGNEFSTSQLYNGDTVSSVTLYSPGASSAAPAADSAYAITPGSALGTGLSNYTITYNNGSLVVTPATLLITANNETKSYGQTLTFAGTEFTTSALFNNDSITSVVLSSPGAATDAAITPTPYPIIPSAASGPGAGNYVITYAPGELTVTRADLVITARNVVKTYGSALTFDGTEFTSGPLFNGDSISSVTLSGAGAATTAAVAGSPYAVSASAAQGTGLDNYNITYSIGGLTVNPAPLSITANNESKSYGQSLSFAGNEFTTSSLYNGDVVTSVSFSSTGAAPAANVAGGPYPIVATAASGSGLGNYSITYNDGSLSVNPASLTITADDQNKPYGQIFAFSNTDITTSTLYNGDTVSGATLKSAGAAAAATVTSSPYSVVASNAFGSGLDNYIISYKVGSFAVTPAALTITADNQSKTYGQAFTFAGTEFAAGSLYNGDTVTGVTLTSSAAATGAAVTGSPYSIVPASAEGSGVGNYAITYVPGSFTVKPATLSITAENRTKSFGVNLVFAGTEFTTSGLLNGDAVSSVSLTSPGAAAAAAIAGSPYPIVPSNASGTGVGNYVITYNPGALTVALPLVTVAGIRDVTNSKHFVTQILVTFSGAVNSTEAGSPGIYTLKHAGKGGSFTARNAKTIKLGSASYNAATNVVTLKLKKPVALTKALQLQISGSLPAGLEDMLGRLIDGDGDGQPGGNVVATLSRSKVVLSRVK